MIFKYLFKGPFPGMRKLIQIISYFNFSFLRLLFLLPTSIFLTFFFFILFNFFYTSRSLITLISIQLPLILTLLSLTSPTPALLSPALSSPYSIPSNKLSVFNQRAGPLRVDKGSINIPEDVINRTSSVSTADHVGRTNYGRPTQIECHKGCKSNC